MAIIDMKTNFGVNIDDINMSDEFETEWIKKEYSYECPNNNYLDGWDSTDTINTIYIGPKTIYFFANNEDGTFESVFREHELPDESIEADSETTLIRFDCASDPLAAEVLCDYHNNFMDDDDWEHEVGQKVIESPEGYENFEYPYPIHPDELYDDLKCRWDFENEKVILHKQTNECWIGKAQSWHTIKAERDVLLRNTDSLYATYLAMDAEGEKTQELATYRQLLRDMPQAFEGTDIPQIFIDSMYPKTTIIEFDITNYDDYNPNEDPDLTGE
jgi:hypothetical protein